MLRPTLLPSRLLRQQPTTTPLLRQFLSTAPSQPPQKPSPSPPKSHPSQKPASLFPFIVGRTHTNNHSVYQLAKRGGNLKLTIVKKVEGNRIAFKEELGKALKLSPKDIKVSSLTGHVEVPGHRKSDIVAFLEEKGL
ncbi:mitochondrial large subunit ribosomal protein-domain-containing protein [Cercophora samala]|uniref:Large ribosomal subunit protein mL49 n=1 Tax=Cercophora samala TaxID=330535 RepID=A0AA40DEK5_9PEZI|nr:mitochondrial large subunit ribosomal protein-domain-containing protein [Cercophora samala]